MLSPSDLSTRSSNFSPLCNTASIVLCWKSKTAEALRSLAHCVDKGRFHWFRETGIIESDDIILIQQEIDKAVQFSKQVILLFKCLNIYLF